MQDFVKELDTPVYQAKFELIQDGGGAGGTTRFRLKASNGTRLLIKKLYIKVTSTASSRGVYIEHFDSNGERISYYFSDGSFASGSFASLPYTNTGNNNSGNNANSENIILVNGDMIVITMYSAGAGEGFDIIGVRGLIRGNLPVIDTTGSGGTANLTTDYARIV
tara:strand:+ start:4782 stop:5276 length:495 start_codon:yes stop_codon:yes gene_type:complete